MIAEAKRPLPPLAVPPMVSVPMPDPGPPVRLRRPQVAPSTHCRVNDQTGIVRLWVVSAGGSEFVFSELDHAMEFRDDWNDHNLPDPTEASIRSASCCVSDLYDPRDGCGMFAAEVPREIIQATVERCAAAGLNPHRLLAAVLLNVLIQMNGGKDPSSYIKALESWESGRRRFKPIAKAE